MWRVRRVWRPPALPHSPVSVLTTVLGSGLLLLALADLGLQAGRESSQPVDLADPAVRAVTWLLLIAITQVFTTKLISTSYCTVPLYNTP